MLCFPGKMANIGFVGLGVMGGNMVSRLLEKGHTVTGYNRTKPEGAVADRAKGMKWGDFAARHCCRSSGRDLLDGARTLAALRYARGPERHAFAGLGKRESFWWT